MYQDFIKNKTINECTQKTHPQSLLLTQIIEDGFFGKTKNESEKLIWIWNKKIKKYKLHII